jgi:hypothetical protein
MRPIRDGVDARAFARACLKPLSRLVWDACDWKWEDYGERWKPGDFNFLVVESTFSSDAILYAQLWSEPLEPVLFEVCSGEMNPGAKRYLAEAKAKLLAMGFAEPEGEGNFRKEIGIWSPADAEVVAAEMLRVVSEVFGYEGRTPLTARLVRNERARRAVVHDSFTPEDVKKILDGAGFKTTMAKETPPMIRVTGPSGLVAAVACDGRKGESNLYTEFDLFVVVEQPTEDQLHSLAGVTDGRFIHGFQDDAGNAAFRASFATHGGITTEAVVQFAARFAGVMLDIHRRLRRCRRAKRATAPRLSKTMAVH